ncbi:MAG: hypothetical protein WBG11_03110, partial [Methylocella sp.]
MQVRLDSGWIGASIGAAAAGATVMWPEHGHSLGIALFAIAALVLIFGIRIEGFRIHVGSRRRLPMIIGVITLGFGILGFAAWWAWPAQKDGNPIPPPAAQLQANQLISSAVKQVYRCHQVAPVGISEIEDKKQKNEMKERLLIVFAALDISLKLTDIPHGLIMELEPKNSIGLIRMGGATKATTEFKRVGDDIFVTTIMSLPPFDGIGEFMTIPTGQETDFPRNIEKIIGVTKG